HAALVGVTAATLIRPVALMWGNHGAWWAAKYCCVVVISLTAVILAVSREDFEFFLGFRDFLAACIGFAATIVALGWFAIVHGSSVHGMVDSLIFQPQRSFGHGWFLEARLPNLAVPWALMGLACAGWSTTRLATKTVMTFLKLGFALGAG